MATLPAGYGRSTISNYLTTLTSIVVALVTVPLLTRGLGREAYGVWALVGATVLYLELLEFGFGATTIQYVSAARARGDEAGVRTAITTSFWLLALPGLVALLLGLALAAGFPRLFTVSPELVGPTRVLLLLLAFDLALSIPGDCFGGALIALQRYDLLNATLITVSVLQAAAWAVVLATGGGIVALGVVTVVLGLAGQLARYVLCLRLLPGLSLRPRHVSRGLVKPYAGRSVWYALSEISNVVISRVDTIVVGAVVGVAEAGVYAVGQKLAQLAHRASSPALAVLFPHGAALAATGDDEGLRRGALLATRISVGLALPLALVLGLLSGPAVQVWVGAAFADAAPVVQVLAAATAVTALGLGARTVVLGTTGVKGVALVEVGEASLNLLLSVFLGLRYGLVGVAAATLIASTLATVLGLVPYASRLLGLQQGSFYGVVVRGHLLPALITGGLAVLLLRLPLGRLLPLLGAGTALGLAYLAVFALTGLRPDERRAFRARLTARSSA
ncbi:MAG: polysaccharide biosynthesis protein [Frankiales bacterium]|nr:polysaccharide biosynthesis protein [Frankiales bacterium]